jgi:hypothetical protein
MAKFHVGTSCFGSKTIVQIINNKMEPKMKTKLPASLLNYNKYNVVSPSTVLEIMPEVSKAVFPPNNKIAPPRPEIAEEHNPTFSGWGFSTGHKLNKELPLANQPAPCEASTGQGILEGCF